MWQKSATKALAAHVQSEEVQNLERAADQVPSPDGLDFEPLVGYLMALLETVAKEPELVLLESDSLQSGVAKPAVEKPAQDTERLIPGTKRVLIVHGHDEVNLHRLADLLKARHLEPVILKREPGKGRTLIEKFEEEAKTCAFAFVLITPDDVVHPADGEDKGHVQARPNVFFELGWAYGRLGRARVCLLFRRGMTISSDLQGVEWVDFIENVEEAVLGIERELKAVHLMPER
jgi:predicted nucleotide-binding protein